MAATMRIPTEFTAIDKFTSVVSKMTSGVSGFSKTTQSAVDRINTKLGKVSTNIAIGGAAIAAPLGLALSKAVEFEDKMADVAKTTGLTTQESEAYGKAILDMSKKTRTSISALQDIGIVGGTIGVAKDELVAFTRAGNEFAIALASDFGGSTEEAVTAVAKLKNLFKETRDLKIDQVITKAGSAINEVSNAAGSAANINDFMLRVGSLPDALKPSIQASAALGGFLEDSGLKAEIAAGGYSNLILVAGKNLPAFAAQMGISTKAAQKLFAEDPTGFAVKFAKSLSKLAPDALTKKLEKLKIGSQETIKVVGALGSGYEKLSKIQAISNKGFADGNSLSSEAAKKNETMAGKLAMAKNNMDALAITVGTVLAPLLNKLIDKVTPFITKIGEWVSHNEGLITGIAVLAGILLGLSFAIKGVQTAMIIGQAVMAAYTFVTGAYAAIAVTAALTGASFAAVIWATIAPILLVVAAIAAIIAIFYYWDEIVAWFSAQWDAFTSFLSEFDFVGMFMSIGQSIIDFMLFPLRSVLELVAMIPGGIGEVAKSGLDELNKMTNLSVMLGDKKEQVASPDQVKSENDQKNKISGRIDMNINDKGGNVGSVTQKGNGFMPVNLTSTQGAF
jgi:TP901 family phage tail tape measure protein